MDLLYIPCSTPVACIGGAACGGKKHLCNWDFIADTRQLAHVASADVVSLGLEEKACTLLGIA